MSDTEADFMSGPQLEPESIPELEIVYGTAFDADAEFPMEPESRPNPPPAAAAAAEEEAAEEPLQQLEPSMSDTEAGFMAGPPLEPESIPELEIVYGTAFDADGESPLEPESRPNPPPAAAVAAGAAAGGGASGSAVDPSMQLNSLAGQVLPLLGPAQASAELCRRCQQALLAVQNLPAQNIRLLRFQTDCMVSCIPEPVAGPGPA